MLFSRGGDKPALIRAKVYGFKILCAGLHRYGKGNFAALARCARVPRAAARRGSLILARGQLRPPLHPPDQGLPPVDPTKGASPSGLPTGRVALPWTPARCFGSGFDQESLRALHGPPDRGRLRSPPGPPSTSRPPSGPCLLYT